MGGNIFVESKYGEGSCFSFYIKQKIETSRPIPKLPVDEHRKVAILEHNKTYALVLADKINRLGAKCDIIYNFEDIALYTHVIFDSSQLRDILNMQYPNTKLIAVIHDIIDNERVPQNIELIYMPLTSSLLLRLLGGTLEHNSSGNTEQDGDFTVQLRDTLLLVVDDSEVNLVIAEDVFEAYGASVDIAESGAEAIEMVQEKDYDIVFMDHMMPDMDGVDTTKIIRQLPDDKYKTLPIIALTANVVGDAREMLLQSGMNDFLSKPMEYKEIEKVLREWLHRDKWSNVQRM